MSANFNNDNLDSPLVVHKETDESYSGTAMTAMDSTHEDEESAPTIERHRFKKEKKEKKSKLPAAAVVVVLVLVAATAALIKFDVIKLDDSKAKHNSTTSSDAADNINRFKNTITVQGMYLFYEGVQVKDIYELQQKIEYIPQDTKLIVQDENANSDLLNYNVTPLLQSLGFDYTVSYVKSTGLVAQDYNDPNFNLEEFNKSLASIEDESNKQESKQQENSDTQTAQGTQATQP